MTPPRLGLIRHPPQRYKPYHHIKGFATTQNICYVITMLNSNAPAATTSDLLHRAAETSLNSARIIARSIELITRSMTIAQAVARGFERTGSVQGGTRRTRSHLATRATKPRFGRHIERVEPLPLTPPRLLEVAEEFRILASNAATPESREAFEDLVFRYTALAAGYDETRVGSRRLH